MPRELLSWDEAVRELMIAKGWSRFRARRELIKACKVVDGMAADAFGEPISAAKMAKWDREH